jgi:hypothetical protein
VGQSGCTGCMGRQAWCIGCVRWLGWVHGRGAAVRGSSAVGRTHLRADVLEQVVDVKLDEGVA